MRRPVAAILATALASGCGPARLAAPVHTVAGPALGASVSAAPDTTLLGTAARMVRAAPAVSRVWPGYWPQEQAFLLLLPPDTALLITTRAVPPEYQQVAGPSLPSELRARAYVRRPYPDNLAKGAGRARYALGRDTVPAFALPAGDPYPARLEFYYHEAFHGYQRGAFARAPGEPETEFRKPSVDPAHIAAPEFRAMGEVERRMLYRALTLQGVDSLHALLRQYLAVRQRRSGTLADVQAVERSMERREGTAELVGCQAAAAALGSAGEDGVSCVRAALEKPLDKFANFPESDARLMRWRHYGTGAALGLLLDRLGVDWRARVQRGAALDEILATVVPLDAAQAPALAGRALADFGFEQFLDDARRASGRTGG